MWQPDGWARTRIGVLTPHADVWPEAEFGAMAPDGISIHAARVPFGAYKPNGTMDRVIADDPVRAGYHVKRLAAPVGDHMQGADASSSAASSGGSANPLS